MNYLVCVSRYTGVRVLLGLSFSLKSPGGLLLAIAVLAPSQTHELIQNVGPEAGKTGEMRCSMGVRRQVSNIFSNS